MLDDPGQKFSALKTQVSAIERGSGNSVFSSLPLDSGIIDQTLGDGLLLGCLHEVAGTAVDGFAAMLAAKFTAQLKEPVLWCVDGRQARHPFAPGLAEMGVATERLTIAYCKTPKDMLWAMEEGLKSGAAALVIGEPSRPLDLTASRRLQLAAGTSGATGLILGQRNLAANACTTRWLASAIPASDSDVAWGGAWRLELTRARNGGTGTWDVIWSPDRQTNRQTDRKDIEHEKTHHLRLVSKTCNRQNSAA
jgi:protein ImuA